MEGRIAVVQAKDYQLFGGSAMALFVGGIVAGISWIRLAAFLLRKTIRLNLLKGIFVRSPPLN